MLSHALACSKLLAASTARADHLVARRECTPPVESGSQDLAFRTVRRLARRSRTTASLSAPENPGGLLPTRSTSRQAGCRLRAGPGTASTGRRGRPDGLTDDEIAALLVQERRVPVDAVASSACDFFDDPPQCHLIEKAADGRGGRAQPGRRVPYCDDGLLGRRVEQPRGGSERRGCAGRRCPAGQLPPGRGLGWVQPRPRAVAALQSRGPSPAMGAPPVSLRGCVRAGGRADNKVRLSAGCSLAAGLGPRSWWPQPWAAPRLAPHRRWCNYHRLSR